MQVVAVDILGPFPESTAGNTYVLVAGDYFTKWTEAYAIPNQEAITIARKLVDQMFCCFSLPEHCLLYTSPSPRDGLLSRMPSSA